jgi:hypothetical protein
MCRASGVGLGGWEGQVSSGTVRESASWSGEGMGGGGVAASII